MMALITYSNEPHDVENDQALEAGEVYHLSIHLQLDLLVHVLAQLPPHELPNADLNKSLERLSIQLSTERRFAQYLHIFHEHQQSALP